MNTTTAPEGWASDPNARALRIELNPDHTYLLPFDQFIHAEVTREAGMQQLHLAFATHEVLIRGHGLKRLIAALQRQELASVTLLPKPVRDAIPDGQPVLLEITVTETKNPEPQS